MRKVKSVTKMAKVHLKVRSVKESVAFYKKLDFKVSEIEACTNAISVSMKLNTSDAVGICLTEYLIQPKEKEPEFWIEFNSNQNEEEDEDLEFCHHSVF